MEEVRQGRKDEARQSGRTREDARQGRKRKRRSAARTKLKSGECNSSDSKMIPLYKWINE